MELEEYKQTTCPCKLGPRCEFKKAKEEPDGSGKLLDITQSHHKCRNCKKFLSGLCLTDDKIEGINPVFCKVCSLIQGENI